MISLHQENASFLTFKVIRMNMHCRLFTGHVRCRRCKTDSTHFFEFLLFKFSVLHLSAL